jgi:tetratricopeptide (TPR) repeat protein
MAKVQINTNIGKQRFEVFSQNVLAKSSKTTTNPIKFSNELREIGDLFVNENQKEGMNKCSKRLAESLVNQKCIELAGRVYSYLIKFNKGNREAIEDFATRGLIIAKRMHDPVHTMARANDLKEVYKHTQFGSDKHLSVLFDEKKALNAIIKNYESAKRRYVSIHTEMKPIERYEEQLAGIKIEIAEILVKRKEFGAAKIELKEALEIYEKYGKGANSEKAENILKKLG